MREQFREEMKELNELLTAEARAAAKAMRQAAESLENANLALAEQVIDSDSKIDLLERNVDELAISLLARQQPVASDLRTVVSAMRISATLERMGDLARHVAYVARGRYPATAGAGEAREVLITMAKRAAEVGGDVELLVESQDLALARKIEEGDDVLDDLHRKSFEYVLDENNEMTRQELVDTVLLGRYLERYGDHCVAVSTRMQFLVTGMQPDDLDGEGY